MQLYQSNLYPCSVDSLLITAGLEFFNKNKFSASTILFDENFGGEEEHRGTDFLASRTALIKQLSWMQFLCKSRKLSPEHGALQTWAQASALIQHNLER